MLPQHEQAVRRRSTGGDVARDPEDPRLLLVSSERAWMSAEPFATDDLGAILAEALPFMSKEAARFVLNGVKVGPDVVASTDGRRLYVAPLPGLPKCGIVNLAKVKTVLKYVRTIRPCGDRFGPGRCRTD